MAEHRLAIARALIGCKKYDLERIRRILYFLKTFLHIDNSEINSNFDNTIEKLTQSNITMGIIETIKKITREEALEQGIEEGIERGIEKGIEQGIEKSKRLFVTNLLLNMDMSLTQIAALADASEEYVSGIAKELGLEGR
jgi:predicted transposase/invertase (TIGR01784 family)